MIENAFGILAARWRLLKTEIIAESENVETFANAAIALHNFLLTRFPSYSPRNYVDTEDSAGAIIPGQWRIEVPGLQGLTQRDRTRCSDDAWTVRESYARFFQEEGAVPWQVAYVNATGETNSTSESESGDYDHFLGDP